MLEGKVKIQLFDAVTGKETHRVEKKNSITNALSSLVNANYFELGRGRFGNTTVSGSGDINPTPMNEIGLGGILLYPEFSKPTDMNDFFEPLTNLPTAYASRLNIVDEDNKLGTFNAIESGEVTGGYKFVYDWTTSAGNGTIGAVALTSRKGGMRYYSDVGYLFSINGAGFGKQISSDEIFIFGISDEGIFTCGTRTNTFNKISFFKHNIKKVELLNNCGGLSSVRTPDWTKTYSVSPEPVPCFDEENNKIYLLSTSGGANSTINMTIIDVEDDFSETTSSLSTNVSLASTARNRYSWGIMPFKVMTMCNGFIYALASTGTSIYKIDISNPANVTEITGIQSGLSVNTSFNLSSDGHLVFISSFAGNTTYPVYVIGEDDTARNIGSGIWTVNPVSRRGVNDIISYDGMLYMNSLSSYMASKFVLENPVVKDASKTMKVSYTVTEGSPE